MPVSADTGHTGSGMPVMSSDVVGGEWPGSSSGPAEAVGGQPEGQAETVAGVGEGMSGNTSGSTGGMDESPQAAGSVSTSLNGLGELASSGTASGSYHYSAVDSAVDEQSAVVSEVEGMVNGGPATEVDSEAQSGSVELVVGAPGQSGPVIDLVTDEEVPALNMSPAAAAMARACPARLLRSMEGVSRLLVYGADHLCTSTVRSVLAEVLARRNLSKVKWQSSGSKKRGRHSQPIGDATSRGLVNVLAVQQQNGVRRFDVFFESAKYARCRNRLVKKCPLLGWQIVETTGYAQRVARREHRFRTEFYKHNQREPLPEEVPTSRPLKELIPCSYRCGEVTGVTFGDGRDGRSFRSISGSISSYNVHRLHGKMELLQQWMQSSGVAVLGLQETWRVPGSNFLRLPGYRVIERMALVKPPGQQHGGVGVALCVREGIRCMEVGPQSPHFIFVKVWDDRCSVPLIVGTVYVPSVSAAAHKQRVPQGFEHYRETVLHHPPPPPVGVAAEQQATNRHRGCLLALRAAVIGLQQRYPDSPMIVMGDWNLREPSLRANVCHKHFQNGLQPQAVLGSPATFNGQHGAGVVTHVHQPTDALRALDHLIISFGHDTLFTKARVNRMVDLSDHWPIGLEVKDTNWKVYMREVAAMRGLKPPLVGLEEGQVVDLTAEAGDSDEEASRDDGWVEVVNGQRAARTTLPRDVFRFEVAALKAHNPDAWPKVAETARSSNYWAVLADELDDVVAEAMEPPCAGAGDAAAAVVAKKRKASTVMAKRLLKASQKCAEEVDVGRQCAEGYGDSRDPRKRRHVRARAGKAILERQEAYAEMMAASALPFPQRQAAWDVWKQKLEKSKAFAKSDAQMRYFAGMANIAEDMYRTPRLGYRAIKAFITAKTRKEAVVGKWNPVVDPVTGILQDSCEGICRAYWNHYSRLFADAEDGHSRDYGYWDQYVQYVSDVGDPIDGTDASDASDGEGDDGDGNGAGVLGRLSARVSARLKWPEVCAALRRMRNGKAAGGDGVPAEWLKLAGDNKRRPEGAPPLPQGAPDDSVFPDAPESDMGRVLFKVLTWVWDTGAIPPQWSESVMVSLFKKGDKSSLDNYRGITLMPTVLKILCVVATARLNEEVERRQILVREQAGFRRREECVAQATALWEVLNRRCSSRMDTYVLFVDFRKAYDTVPHGALLAKLKAMGMRGRFLRFVKALYAESTVRIQYPEGVSPPITMERGVRQGDPLSPLLFNLFINDIFNDPDLPGVVLPFYGDDGRIVGLLFADDCVGLAGTPPDLQRTVDAFQRWSDKWGMSINARKCGVLCVPRRPLPDPPEGEPPVEDSSDISDDSDDEDVESDEEDTWNVKEIRLSVLRRMERRVRRLGLEFGGVRIPVIRSYMYLGMLFTPRMGPDGMSWMARGRRKCTEGAFNMLLPLLGCQELPLALRVRVAKTNLLPVALYGAELWGGSRARAQPMQTVMNKAVRALVGLGFKTTAAPTCVMQRELGIAPVAAFASARRARACRKFPQMRTWMGVLSQHENRIRNGIGFSRGTWTAHSRRVLRQKKCVPLDKEDEPERQWYIRTVAKEWERWDIGVGSQGIVTTAMHRYNSCDLQRTTLAKAGGGVDPELGRALKLVTQARMWALPVTTSLVRRRVVPMDSIWVDMCPCCMDVDIQTAVARETIPHMLLECPRWADLRTMLLGRAIAEASVILDAQGIGHVAVGDEVAVDGRPKVSDLFGSAPSFSVRDFWMSVLLLGGAVGKRRLSHWCWRVSHSREHNADDDLGSLGDEGPGMASMRSAVDPQPGVSSAFDPNSATQVATSVALALFLDRVFSVQRGTLTSVPSSVRQQLLDRVLERWYRWVGRRAVTPTTAVRQWGDSSNEDSASTSMDIDTGSQVDYGAVDAERNGPG